MRKVITNNIEKIIGIVIIMIIIGMLILLKQMNFISILLLLGVIEIIFFISCTLKNYFTLTLFTLIILFQNIVLIISTNFINKSEFTLLLLVKEIYLLSVLFIFPNIYLKGIKLKKTDKLAILILGYILLEFIISPFEIMAKLANARELASVILLYLFGRAINLSTSYIKRYIKFLINIGLFISIVGFVEVTIGVELWRYMGIEKFMQYKGMGAFLNGQYLLPNNFYTYDLYNIIGRTIRRLVSIIAEPTTTGQVLVLPLVCLIVTSKKEIKFKYLKIIIMLIAIIMVLGKGAYLILLISLVYYIKKYYKNKLFGNIVFLSIILTSLVLVIMSLNEQSSIGMHAKGLINNIISLPQNILGNGIGSTGNFAMIYNTNVAELGAGESFVGVIIGQFGLVGIVLYSLFAVFLCKDLEEAINQNKELRKESIVAKGAFIGVVCAMFLSQSAAGFIAISLYMILIGILITNSEKLSMKK